jgi:hypothetical protein
MLGWKWESELEKYKKCAAYTMGGFVEKVDRIAGKPWISKEIISKTLKRQQRRRKKEMAKIE